MKKKNQTQPTENGNLPATVIEAISKYNYTLATAQQVKAGCLAITVKDLKDRVNIALATETRKQVKQWRLQVEKIRKEQLNAPLYDQIRLNNRGAKTLREIFLEGELHLRKIDAQVKDWRAEKRAEKERQLMERLQTRIDQLAPFNIVPDLVRLKEMNDKDFATLLEQTRKDFEETQAQKKADASKIFQDNERLRQENENLKKNQQPAPEPGPAPAAPPVAIINPKEQDKPFSKLAKAAVKIDEVANDQNRTPENRLECYKLLVKGFATDVLNLYINIEQTSTNAKDRQQRIDKFKTDFEVFEASEGKFY